MRSVHAPLLARPSRLLASSQCMLLMLPLGAVSRAAACRPAGLVMDESTCRLLTPLSADFGIAASREYELAGFAFLHDFALTENYYVLFQNPVTGASYRGAQHTCSVGR